MDVTETSRERQDGVGQCEVDGLITGRKTVSAGSSVVWRLSSEHTTHRL